MRFGLWLIRRKKASERESRVEISAFIRDELRRTIRKLELGRADPQKETTRRIIDALQSAGVEFTEGGAVKLRAKLEFSEKVLSGLRHLAHRGIHRRPLHF